MPLSAVMISNLVSQFCQSTVHVLDETAATGSAATKTDYRIPFSVILRHGQNLAVGTKTMHSPLDHLICGLSLPRVKDLDHCRRCSSWPARGRT